MLGINRLLGIKLSFADEAATPMFQDSTTVHPVDMRRRRRFKISNRTYFGYGLAFLEGLFAFGFVLASSLFLGNPMPWGNMLNAGIAALAVGVAYGLSALPPADWLVQSADKRLHGPLHAAASWLIVLALVWLAGIVLSGTFVVPERATWEWLLVGALLVAFARWALHGRLAAMMANGQFQIERTAIVGSSDVLRRFEREARIWKQGGQVVVRHALGGTGETTDAVLADFAALCAERRCNTVLLVGDLGSFLAAGAVIEACRPYAMNVAFAPISEHGGQLHTLHDVLRIGPANAVRVMRKPLSDGALAAKRAMDIVGAGIGLLLIAPVMLATALAIRLSGPGPILYRQERKGFNGHSFYIFKFRSMSVTEDGRSMKPAVSGDERITPIGHFIRRTSIDELPQLLNVIRGDMSLVGPRPHAVSHDAELSRDFSIYARRQRIKPGITGWAQVNGFRGEIATQGQLEGRTLHDLEYVENWSVWFDLKVLWLTLFSRKVHRNAG